MSQSDAERIRDLVEAVCRRDSRRIFATLIRRVGDFDGAPVYWRAMGRFCKTLVAFGLTCALMPGLFEVVENSAHLLREGHWAHAESTSDHHGPASPEHGCTPTLHLCGCHASLAFLVPQFTAPPALGADGAPDPVDPVSPLNRFVARIERPPQA